MGKPLLVFRMHFPLAIDEGDCPKTIKRLTECGVRISGLMAGNVYDRHHLVDLARAFENLETVMRRARAARVRVKRKHKPAAPPPTKEGEGHGS